MTTGRLSPDAWERITELFGEVLDLPPERRRDFLADQRTRDPATAQELASLLEQHEQEGEFLPELEPQPVTLSDLSGRMVGSYRLVRLLGSGGMGTVYLGERSDGAFAKEVAVKLLATVLPHTRERFLRERDVLARLEHPHIAHLIDGGSTPDGWLYLVMEYVEGLPIDRYCALHDLSVGDRLELLHQVCAGVAHAHRNLIVHCDIKPENILVTSGGQAKLLDFGIAKLLDVASSTTLFRPSTPAFSSPEQLQGDPVTTSSDVYSIGVLAYVVLTGSGPYPLKSNRVDEVVRAALTAEPVRASLSPQLPPQRARRLRGDLDNILAKALAKDPTRRYASVQQLADDLEAHRRGFPVRARPDSLAYRLRKFASRHRVASVTATVAMAALVVALGVTVWQARIAERRFDDLHALAHAVVFDVNDSLATIPGTTATRKLVVETALRYLDRLSAERVTDVALIEELAAAYIRIGKVQGGAFLPNLGDSAGAVSSFRKAAATVDRAPTNPRLDRLGIEARVNIGLLAVDPEAGAPEFDAAIEAADRELKADADDVDILRLVATAYHGRATIGHLTDHQPDNEAMSRREIAVLHRIRELAPGAWQDALALTRAFGQLALALVQQLDYAGALEELRKAREVVASALERDPRNQLLIRGFAENRLRTGATLLALDRTADAAIEVESAVGLLNPLVASDAQNMQYKADLSYAWLHLAEVRWRQGDRANALMYHQTALALRRERAARSNAFMFVPWELTRSLNAVGESLLDLRPDATGEAAALFAEAKDVGERVLAAAPSFNEVRKQVANAYEGLARVALLRKGTDATEARALLERSAETWREVAARSVGDRRDEARAAAVERQLASMSSNVR